MTEIKIREVNENDYRFIHDLLYETWYKDEEQSEELKYALAEMYLNHCLNRGTLGLVAEMAGEPVGFILTRVIGEEPVLRQLQTDPYDAFLPILNVSGREFVEQTAYLKREIEINAEMLEQSETNFDAEICLFIVSPKGRGKGIGNKLYQAVLDEFERLNVHDYYLFTDDGCNVQFYEKREMYRALERTFNPTETLEESAYNLYLYQNKP